MVAPRRVPEVTMFSEGDIGVLPPLGVYDPLGLIASRDINLYEEYSPSKEKNNTKLADLYKKQVNKENDNDWFNVEPNEDGTKWKGTCWYVHNLLKYEFVLQFEIPAGYPSVPIELELPELDGKTPKMYRGGKICLDIHFSPLWRNNVPKFGIAHALSLALGPWLAAEIPYLIDTGVVVHVDKAKPDEADKA